MKEDAAKMTNVKRYVTCYTGGKMWEAGQILTVIGEKKLGNQVTDRNQERRVYQDGQRVESKKDSMR